MANKAQWKACEQVKEMHRVTSFVSWPTLQPASSDLNSLFKVQAIQCSAAQKQAQGPIPSLVSLFMDTRAKRLSYTFITTCYHNQ